MRVNLLQCGYCIHPQFATMSGGGFRPAKYPSSVAVIEHPKHGIILFDTGYTNHFIEATKYFPEKIYRMVTPVHIDDSVTAVAQLRELGIAADDVSHVIISHFHGDHVAGLRDFPRAKFIFLNEGYEFIQSLGRLSSIKNGVLFSLIPEDFLDRAAPLVGEDLVTPTFRDSSESKIAEVFGGYFDIFGDQSILGVPLPGHFPGQMGLFIQASRGPLLLAADACWHIENLDKKRRPNRLALKLLNASPAYDVTIDGLVEISKLISGIRIVPCHCNETLVLFSG